MDADRHDLHHAHLASMQEKIDRIWQAQYERAKKQSNRAPRKFATRATHSQRVSQVAAWRSHLYGLHGVPTHGPGTLGPFVSLAELQQMHERLHAEEVACRLCDGKTIPPTPGRPEEEDHYCESCGTTTDSKRGK